MPNEPIEVTLRVTQFARAPRQAFELETKISANFASAENIILSKLEWYRMGGGTSERQWRDILDILKTREGKLDLEYLKKWAIDLNITDLPERALKESA